MKTLVKTTAVSAAALAASASAAVAGPIADMAQNVDFEGMKTDIGALGGSIIGYVIAASTIILVISMLRRVMRG